MRKDVHRRNQSRPDANFPDCRSYGRNVEKSVEEGSVCKEEYLQHV